MQALRHRTQEQGIAVHAVITPRVYFEDSVQKARIERSRACVQRCIDWLGKTARIVELGCGTCDISGPFAEQHLVSGVDCNSESLRVAQERFPSIAHLSSELPFLPIECDILVMCEFLEHLNEPGAVVKQFMPSAQYSVISHPINGDLVSDDSAGEHLWSLAEADFDSWFALGGHKLVHVERFLNGGYDTALGIGERI